VEEDEEADGDADHTEGGFYGDDGEGFTYDHGGF